MKLVLIRKIFDLDRTLGEMFLKNGDKLDFICYTLEDAITINKIYGESAISDGTYTVVNSMSNRFKKILPEILNVKGYAGVRIHGGNNEKNTLGCILVGEQTDKKTKIWNCDKSVTKIIEIIKKNGGKIELDIV